VVYRLKYNPGVEAVHDALPQAASDAMTQALAAACRDPYGATLPHGEDDGVVRSVLTTDAHAIVLIAKDHEEVIVLDMIYLR
jgi:hypothetical protein